MLYMTHGRLAALPVVQPNSARTVYTNAIQCAELLLFWFSALPLLHPDMSPMNCSPSVCRYHGG